MPSNSKKTIKEQLDEYVGVQKVVITGIFGGLKLGDTNHLVGDLNIRSAPVFTCDLGVTERSDIVGLLTQTDVSDLEFRSYSTNHEGDVPA